MLLISHFIGCFLSLVKQHKPIQEADFYEQVKVLLQGQEKPADRFNIIDYSELTTHELRSFIRDRARLGVAS